MSDPGAAPGPTDDDVARLLKELGLDAPRRLHAQPDTVSLDLSLGRINAVLARLGDPQHRLPPVIHIAGTNGKGSTLAFCRAFAESEGLSVHAYTSPHLVRFNERIELAGAPIANDRLIDVLTRVAAARGDAPLSFFEAVTAAAFIAFAETAADLCLLEVGMGGRYDTTNVIAPPAAAAIAPVDYDHKEFLGDTLAAIAGEKAGVLKPGGVAAIARQAPEALEVIEAEAERVGARLWVADRDWRAGRSAEGGLLFESDTLGRYETGPLGLPGDHQIGNAGLALAASLLQRGALPDEAVRAGAERVRHRGRLQRLTPDEAARLGAGHLGAVWLDGGHNPHAGEALAAYFRARGERPALVVAMQANKDAAGFLAPWRGCAARLLAIPFPPPGQGWPPEQLAEIGRAAGLEAAACPSLEAAFAAVEPGGLALIAGSLYLAGDVLRRAEAA